METLTESFQVCHDFSNDKIIFEIVIGFLGLCLLLVLGKTNQEFIISMIRRVYIRPREQDQV